MKLSFFTNQVSMDVGMQEAQNIAEKQKDLLKTSVLNKVLKFLTQKLINREF